MLHSVYKYGVKRVDRFGLPDARPFGKPVTRTLGSVEHLQNKQHNQFVSRTERNGVHAGLTPFLCIDLVRPEVENIDHRALRCPVAGTFCYSRRQQTRELPEIGNLGADVVEVAGGDLFNLGAGRFPRPA